MIYYASIVYLQSLDKDTGWKYLEMAINKGFPTDLIRQAPEFEDFADDIEFRKILDGQIQ